MPCATLRRGLWTSIGEDPFGHSPTADLVKTQDSDAFLAGICAVTNHGPSDVLLISGEAIARYGFGDGHPFGTDRHEVFMRELQESELDRRVQHGRPRTATREELEAFHTPQYIDLVRDRSATGRGFLDAGDTPARKGIFEAASNVVGATLNAVDAVMAGTARRAFIPIAGLHHASRTSAAGFCVFNDCGVAIEILRSKHGVQRIAYVDIDAHHGDGVFYAFEDDP